MAGPLDRFRIALLARRRRLVRTAERARQELRSLQGAAPDAELVEEAQRTREQSVLQDLDEVQRAHLEEIDLALQRIEQGTYGSCVDCGVPIDGARLSALPTATSCRRCAESRERGQAPGTAPPTPPG